MSNKPCTACGLVKPLSEYYASKNMADGHSGKCKRCTIAYMAANVARKKTDPEWLVLRRKQARESKRRRPFPPNGTGPRKYKDPAKQKAKSIFDYNVKIKNILKLPCQICGNNNSHGHHEDYSKPLEVVWLCAKHHSERHVYLRDCETLGIKPTPFDFNAEIVETPAESIAF